MTSNKHPCAALGHRGSRTAIESARNRPMTGYSPVIVMAAVKTIAHPTMPRDVKDAVLTPPLGMPPIFSKPTR